MSATNHMAFSHKSAIHDMVQDYILARLPLKEAEKEFFFPKIRRIADVAWLDARVVFEVQCSSITLEEMRTRQSDYRRAGFQVIWVLHAAIFNKKRKTVVEEWLAGHPHYYVEVNARGDVAIFDTFDIVCNGYRLWQSSPIYMIEELFSIEAMPEPSCAIPSPLPSSLKLRKEHWPVRLSGDLWDSMVDKKEDFISIARLESALLKKARVRAFWRYIAIVNFARRRLLRLLWSRFVYWIAA